MKIAFDVDVLAKQMDINRMVHQVADWGYKYIEQSPHPRINPFYKHPLFSEECEKEYRKAGISLPIFRRFLCVTEYFCVIEFSFSISDCKNDGFPCAGILSIPLFQHNQTYLMRLQFRLQV